MAFTFDSRRYQMVEVKSRVQTQEGNTNRATR
jgi:hypothetical protein